MCVYIHININDIDTYTNLYMKARVIGGLKSIIRKFEINNRRPEINNRRAVEAKQILSCRDICSDARFAINCQDDIDTYTNFYM